MYIMAFIQCSVNSNALQMATGLTIILPEDKPVGTCKVLYLLHGLSDNHSGWSRYTSVELFARTRNLVVVMPEVQRSFYNDMNYGMKYFTYISKELPLICKNMFNISTKKEDTYIFGLSMGGLGAMKCAFTLPDNYAGCGCFSSVFDTQGMIEFNKNDAQRTNEARAIYGMELEVDDANNLHKLVDSVPKEKAPRLFCTCGNDDFLKKYNLEMEAHLEKIGADYTFLWWEGTHSWEFWNDSLKKALEYFEI